MLLVKPLVQCLTYSKHSFNQIISAVSAYQSLHLLVLKPFTYCSPSLHSPALVSAEVNTKVPAGSYMPADVPEIQTTALVSMSFCSPLPGPEHCRVSKGMPRNLPLQDWILLLLLTWLKYCISLKPRLQSVPWGWSLIGLLQIEVRKCVCVISSPNTSVQFS